jgi:hypothetical protein
MSNVRYTKTISIKPWSIVTDDEGSKTTAYSDTAHTIKANVQPKTKNLTSSPIGERIGATLIGFTDLSSDIKEKDGVCINGSAPDHYVSAVDVYRTHKTFELIRIGN